MYRGADHELLIQKSKVIGYYVHALDSAAELYSLLSLPLHISQPGTAA
jgi:hypothetical protein